MTTTTTTWSIEALEAAIAAESKINVGHLTLGCGEATLPSAEDGAPVAVSASTALEAITQHGGLCWVDGDGGLTA